MQYKCYFHPKTDGADLCKGCKLPVCAGCKHSLGFCPECMRKRDAVDDLRQLRSAVSSKARVASSTTARLRLAIRQVGPIAKRGRLVDTTMLGTGRLPGADAWQQEAMAVDAKVPTHFKEMMAQRKSQWTYDPDRVAYKGVKQFEQGGAKKAPVQRTTVAGRIHRPRAEATPAGAGWGKPFAMGLAVGLVVVLIATFGQGALKAPAKAKSKPLLSQDTAAVTAMVRRVTGTDDAAQRARAKAAARRALMNAAFAEGSAAAARAEASVRAQDAANAQAYRAAVAATRVAAAPAAPAHQAARPVSAPRTTTFSRPAPRHEIVVPRGFSGGITAQLSNGRSTWRKNDNGTLVTTW